jgi:hypothetical protein
MTSGYYEDEDLTKAEYLIRAGYCSNHMSMFELAHTLYVNRIRLAKGNEDENSE